MPDIREVLKALSVDDRALWSEHRTTMRRSYLQAHNATVGIATWVDEDDMFLDLIDIKLALLFDRSGRLSATTDIIGNGHKIEESVLAKGDAIKPSEATKMMQTKEWK